MLRSGRQHASQGTVENWAPLVQMPRSPCVSCARVFCGGRSKRGEDLAGSSTPSLGARRGRGAGVVGEKESMLHATPQAAHTHTHTHTRGALTCTRPTSSPPHMLLPRLSRHRRARHDLPNISVHLLLQAHFSHTAPTHHDNDSEDPRRMPARHGLSRP